MRSLLLFACLCISVSVMGQGSGFSFSYTGPTQILVGSSCMAPLNWGHPNTPTATSNIPGGMIVSFDIYSISGGYDIGDPVMGGTTVTVFYQALDNFGNTALFGFTITFIDLQPPVFDPLSLPQNITISCVTNLPPPAIVEASDNCADEDPPLTITYTQTNNAVLCTGGTVQRRWVADDDLGNTAQYIQNITVTADNTPPVIANNLVNGMAPCSTAMAQYSTWLNTQRANFSATDAGCGIMTLSDNAPSPATITSFCGEVPVTFTAKDNCNNTSTVVRTFTVTNNVAPIITTPASGASGDCSAPNIALTFANWIANHGGAMATDDCSSIFWTTFPANPSIADTCDAAIEVMFIAGDGCNNFDTTTASFVLIDDTPPAITVQPTTMLLGCTAPGLDSTLMDWLVTGGHSMASDLCTPVNQLQLGYQLNGVEASLQEVLNAWQDSLQAGCNDGVIINGVGINNVLALLEVRFTYDDNCDNQGGAIGYFGITDNGRPVFDTLPSSLAFSCSGGNDWITSFNDWYNSAGNADYSDACSDVTLTASMTADSAIAILMGALDTACFQGVSVSIQFSLQDECGNMSATNPSASFSLGDTIPPVLITPASDFTASCALDIQTQLQQWLDTLGGATATDGCGDLAWQFSWIDTAGMTQSGVPDAGPYPEVGDLGCNEAIDIIFTVTDICQNSVSDTASFTVTDTTGPAILIANDTILLSCMDTFPDLTPVVTDECDPTPLITFEDSVSADSCLGRPTEIIRTYIATDDCGNSSSAVIHVINSDTIAPTFDLPPDTVAFCEIDTLTLSNVADNCDPSPVVTFNDEITGLTCNQTLLRTWIVTDACGNSATAVQSFDLSDDAPPTIVYSPGHFVFSCDAAFESMQAAYAFWQDSVVITDACSDASYFIAVPGSYIFADTTTWPGTPLPDSIMIQCGDNMTINADLVAYDACGNAIVENISFTLNDTVGPTINCLPQIVVAPDTITCTALVTLTVPGYEEICFPDGVRLQLVLDSGDTINVDTIIAIDTILPVGIHSAIWIATDCIGNQGICETTVGVIDEYAISMTCPPDTVVYVTSDDCKYDLFVYAPPTVTAGCGLGAAYWRGYIDGVAEPDTFLFNGPMDSILVSFGAGFNQVFLIVADSTGDIDTCRYLVDVRDTIAPAILCQADTVVVSTSGLDTILLNTTSLLLSAMDACGVDSIHYDPVYVSCDQSGQSIAVTITVSDAAGNTSSCVTTVEVMTQALLPTWQRGLCDDTLRLFANLPQDSLAGYVYTWTGPNGFMSAEENPVIANTDSSFSGTYTLTVQSASGCTSTGSMDVMIEDLVAPIIEAVDDTVCAGDSIVLNSQVFAGGVYQWYEIITPGDSILLGATNDPQFIISNAAVGAHLYYAIIVSDTCSSAPGPVITVEVSVVPVALIADVPAVLCLTDSLFLMPEMVIDSFGYVWNGPGGYSSALPIPPGIAASDIDSSAVFTLTVSNANCTSSPDSVMVVVQPIPATPTITGDAQACEDGTIQLIASPDADNFIWIAPDGNTIPASSDTLLLSNVDTTDAGGWTVIAFSNGCPSDTSDAFEVTVDTAISITITTTAQVCEGDSITLTIVPAISGDFTWTGPGGFVSAEPSPTVLAESGIYAASVMTTTGCAATDDIEVVVDVLPVILELETDADTCANGEGDVIIWASADPAFSGALTYHWFGPQPFTAMDSSIVLSNVTTDFSGTYGVSIVNGACTSDTATIDLLLVDSPAEPVITGDNVYCSGDTIVLTIQNPIPGATYTWSSNDTTAIVDSPGTFIWLNAMQDQTGVYMASVSIAGCTSAAASFAVQVKAPLSTPTITGTGFVCAGDSLLLQSNAPAGATFTWSGPNGFTSSASNPVIFPATTNDAGSYTLTYEINGCTSPASASFEVNVQAALTAPAIATDVIRLCIDAPVPVTICVQPGTQTPGGSYSWILNGTTQLGNTNTDTCITVDGDALVGGVNAITVITSLQGCTSDTSDAVIIQGDEIPAINADAGTETIYCPNDQIVLNGNDPSPGTGTWTSSDPFVMFEDEFNPTTTLLPLPSGEYVVTWTLSYETCVDYSTDSVSISVITVPITIPDTVSVPFGQTGEFIVTLNDMLSNEPYTLTLKDGPDRGNALHVGNGVFRYTPNLGFVGTDMMIYEVCSRDCPEECSEAVVIIRVGSESDCFVPSLFTPNEDGINDVLIVPCLETSQFMQNAIIIFNEWGDAVFNASPYLNDWDGTVSGNPLPVGTYFYIMDFGDGSTPKRSFLILER